jgi:hypothetical protein
MLEPEQRECETFGYPNTDTTGETQYQNTHFRTEAAAWKSILENAEAGVKLSGAMVKDAEETLLNAQKRAAESAREFSEVHQRYDRWKRNRTTAAAAQPVI